MSQADALGTDVLGTDFGGVDVSVVVCSYNGASKLATCLEALERQTVRRRAEIIVVDDGSTDDTALVAKSFDVELVTHPINRGLAAARNTGVGAASGAVVAFTDDDCVPSADWLQRLLERYDSDRITAVGGVVTALVTDNLTLRYLAANSPLAPLEADLEVSTSIPYRGWLYLRRNMKPTARNGIRPVYSMVGANMSFRRRALVDLGGFDERISFGGEEEDLCRRLRDVCGPEQLIVDPAAIVGHDFDPGFGDTLRRSYSYGKGSTRKYLKNRTQAPTIYPLPAIVWTLALGGIKRRSLLAAAVVAPLLVFSRWVLQALVEGDARVLSYAYLQLLQETASDLGSLQAAWRLRGQYRSESPSPS